MPHDDKHIHNTKAEHSHKEEKHSHPTVESAEHVHVAPPAGTRMLSANRGKIKFVERLRGAYAGREIWVLATGPSLDDIPNDFLSVDETIESDPPVPKVSIAVKEAAIPFPNCTYNIWALRDYGLRHQYIPRGLIAKKFGKLIFSIRKVDTVNYFGQQSLRSTFMRYSQGGTIPKMQATCASIVAKNSSVYCGIGTITHLAIEAALVMGASKVSLVGCEHGAVGGKPRAQNRGIAAGYGWGRQGMAGYEIMKVGTNFLANYFKDHGVEIVRYYHGRGYEPIAIEKQKEEEEDATQTGT